MNDLRLALNKQLNKLESERDLIDVAIEEIQRRYGVLDDVESWGLLDEADEFSSAYESSISEVELMEDDEVELETAVASGEDPIVGVDGFGFRPRDLGKAAAREA